MKHVFAVETVQQLAEYQHFVETIQPRLDTYMKCLRGNYSVTDLPRVILWTDYETATKGISDIPVPAYTNDYRTVMTPDLDMWRKIYLAQLDGCDWADEEMPIVERVRDYYRDELNENHILQILGHELAHHSDYFPDDEERDTGIWFEEGMVEYISRRFFLTKAEFAQEAMINALLVQLLQKRYGARPLDDFGQATYSEDYGGIFFAYWRSFLAVKQLVDTHGGDVHAVFAQYHTWYRTECTETFEQWLVERKLLT